jgi:hypothetical protein
MGFKSFWWDLAHSAMAAEDAGEHRHALLGEGVPIEHHLVPADQQNGSLDSHRRQRLVSAVILPCGIRVDALRNADHNPRN